MLLISYVNLLDRVLEDQFICDTEQTELVDLAQKWQLDADSVDEIHKIYLTSLVAKAFEDGKLDDTEIAELRIKTTMLGMKSSTLDTISKIVGRGAYPTRSATTRNSKSKNVPFASVCFSGESQCNYKGERLTRELAEILSAGAELNVLPRVTKKLGALVVADENTMSQKAQKAREYGVPVIHEKEFWALIGYDFE